MVLHFSFGGAQDDLLELLVVAVAIELLNVCSFHELHAKGHACLFKGAHELPAVVNLTVLLKQQTGFPVGG
jgi:hypothetical protein